MICEKIDSEMSRKISCILYKYPIPLFDGFIQFQTKHVTNKASMQEMSSIHSQISFIELYIKFEQSEVDQNIEREYYNSDSDKEFESNYDVVGSDGGEDQGDGTMQANVTNVTNALANQHLFEEPSFMRTLDLEAMHAPKFSEYMNIQENCHYGYGRLYCLQMCRLLGLDSNTITEVIKSLVEVDPSIKVKSVIAKVQSKFNYTISYRKAWLAKHKSVKKYSKVGKYRAKLWLCRNIQVNCFDRQNKVFEGREMPSGWSMPSISVDKDVTVDRIPCRHVFSFCVNQPLDWQVYVHDVYKMDPVRRVYRVRPRFVLNPFLRRVAKDRPRITCFLNEMDTRILRVPRRCRQCGVEGHSRNRYRQSGGASTSNNTH
ncbi:hypothetical protein Ahy_A01g001282 [Arachis hypogaea]|uniref:Transposase MuDR plant domain-containing protein n=1 Tax=Arachis hypogaea TaxID=3818 RepID=A0A445EML6_ARAHY|nr:hypothetical protein Ahy_A01g001282 [Arachis hypogaea]